MKLRYKIRSWWKEVMLNVRVLQAAAGGMFNFGSICPAGRLYATKIHKDGTREKLGLICTKVVTTAGVGFIVDAFQNLAAIETMRFHAAGTSGTAEAVGDTTLGTQVETRTSGTLAEGASANIFRTIGTIAFTATRSIVEHGIFSASTGGTLLDRSVFASIGVDNGDSIEFTYELTVPAGS